MFYLYFEKIDGLFCSIVFQFGFKKTTTCKSKSLCSCFSSRVDFTNVFTRIFRARFSYKCLFSSYVLQKTRAKTLVKSTPEGIESNIMHVRKVWMWWGANTLSDSLSLSLISLYLSNPLFFTSLTLFLSHFLSQFFSLSLSHFFYFTFPLKLTLSSYLPLFLTLFLILSVSFSFSFSPSV